MVVVEIRSPAYDGETETVGWRTCVLIRADGTDLQIHGDQGDIVDRDMPVVDLSTGSTVSTSKPEAWARNLPYAFRSGDYVAVVLHDDAPPALGEQVDDFEEVAIPPAPALNRAEAIA